MLGRSVHQVMIYTAGTGNIAVMVLLIHRLAVGMHGMHVGGRRRSIVRGTARCHGSRSKSLHGNCHDQQPQKAYLENTIHFFILLHGQGRAGQDPVAPVEKSAGKLCQ